MADGAICSFTFQMDERFDFPLSSVVFLSQAMEELHKKAAKMTARDSKYAPNCYPPDDSMVWAAITLMDHVFSDNIYAHPEDANPGMKVERLEVVKSTMLSRFGAGLIESVELKKNAYSDDADVGIVIRPDPCQAEQLFGKAYFSSGTMPQVKELAKQYRADKALASSKAIKPGLPRKSMATRKDTL